MFLFKKKKYALSSCFGRLFDRLDADALLASSSIKKYREISNRIVNEIGDIDIRNFDIDMITKLKKVLNERNCSSARKNHYLVTSRLLLKFLKEEESIDVLDYTLVKKFKEEKRAVEFLTDEEVRIYLDSISETNITRLRLKTLVLCLLSTGARISEILSLNREDIDFGTGLAITKGKGGKINQVIFNDLSLEYLGKYLSKRTDNCPALFITGKDTRWAVNCSERAVRNQGRRAGLNKRVYCHLFRKTAASKMFFSGAPLPVVSKFLSHSDLATTQKYYLRGANFEEVQQYHKNTMNFGLSDLGNSN